MDFNDVGADAFEDPTPPSRGVNGLSSVPTAKPLSRSLNRRLLYRADVNPEGRRYKGRKVSRETAELDRSSIGLLDHSADEADSDSGAPHVSDAEKSTGVASNSSGPTSEDESESADEDLGDPDLFVVSAKDSEEDAHGDDNPSNDIAREPESDGSYAEQGSSTPPLKTGQDIQQFRRQALVVEERAIARRLATAKEKDAQRASAVKIQMALQETIMRLRIQLEPLVNVARSLPTCHQRETSDVWKKSPAVDQGVASAEKELHKLIAKTDSAFNSMWPSEEHGPSDPDAFDQWRNIIMDRWNRKLLEASGKAPKGGFKVLDLSVSTAIRSTLDTNKPRQRVQRVKEPLALVGGGTVPSGEWEYHFDDGELYRNMLRDVIEGGATGDGGLLYAKAGKRKGKKRKCISYAKGKRLKYDVMDKLVGFLAPVPARNPGPLNEIIANLFGKQGEVKNVEY